MSSRRPFPFRRLSFRSALAASALLVTSLAAHADTSFVVTARGTSAGGTAPLMVVYFNGVVVGSAQVTTVNFHDYRFWGPDAIATKGGRIDVQFANDAIVNGQDRNLFVRSLTVNGETIASTNSARVVFDRGGPAYARATDNVDVIPPQEAMPWNGALRYVVNRVGGGTASTAPAAAAAPAVTTVTASVTPAPTTTSSSSATSVGAPSPTQFDNLPARVGPIVVFNSGTVISDVRISNPNGDCIEVRPGVTNVTIRNAKIGPCGVGYGNDGNRGFGVRVTGGVDTTVDRVVFTGVSAGVYADWGAKGVQVTRSHFSQLWGGLSDGGSKGTAVQLNGVSNSGRASKISCNVVDNHYGAGSRSTNDVISVFGSSGTSSAPIEVAYNKVRGGNAGTGSGIMIGDHGGAWTWTHDNILVLPSNVGVGVAGGSNHRVENNRVWAAGDSASSMTCNGFYAFAQAGQSLANVTLNNNRGYGRCWLWGGSGEVARGWHTDGSVSNLNLSNNNFVDGGLNASIWNETVSACQW